MRIIVIGGTGTIGKAIVKELKPRHEIIVAGHSHGDVQVDIENTESIEKMFKSAGEFNAVVVATGKVHFAEFPVMTLDNYYIGLNNKLMGQVNVVLIGSRYISDSGSFTLTSGILNREPIRGGSSASMVNSALEGFVRGSAIEMPRSIRINCVSPTVLKESMDAYADFFRGFEPVAADRVALAYSKSVEGLQTGQIYNVP